MEYSFAWSEIISELERFERLGLVSSGERNAFGFLLGTTDLERAKIKYPFNPINRELVLEKVPAKIFLKLEETRMER